MEPYNLLLTLAPAPVEYSIELVTFSEMCTYTYLHAILVSLHSLVIRTTNPYGTHDQYSINIIVLSNNASFGHEQV